jgi:hypothetical protein
VTSGRSRGALKQADMFDLRLLRVILTESAGEAEVRCPLDPVNDYDAWITPVLARQPLEIGALDLY